MCNAVTDDGIGTDNLCPVDKINPVLYTNRQRLTCQCLIARSICQGREISQEVRDDVIGEDIWEGGGIRGAV